MTKNKKILTGIIAAVVAVAMFIAGFFLSDKLFPKETDEGGTTLQDETTTAPADGTAEEPEDEEGEEEEEKESEYLYILDDEKLGSGEIRVSKAEYEFYCVSIYNTLLSSSFQYDYYYGEGAGLLYTGYDWQKLPGEQECSMEINGKTFKNYEEYIEYVAAEQILATKSCVEYAELNSITLDDDELAEIDSFIAENKETIAAEGMEFEEYLQKYYGPGMSEGLYLTVVKEQYLVNKVDEVKSEILDVYYTTEKVEAAYNENITTYGQVSLRYYIVGAATDDTGAVYEASMKTAKGEAEVFAGLVSDDKSFMQRASDKDKKNGSEEYANVLIDDKYTLFKDVSYEEIDMETSDKGLAPWAFDTERKVGDVYVAEIEGVGYGVYMISNPVHKPSTVYTYDVRHILVKFPEGAERDTSTKVKLLNPADYDVTVDIDVYPDITADHALYMQAQGILEQYLAGDCTEESFAELAKTHSADGNASSGGIYEEVPEGQMVSSFENWALEENRKPGDVGIVESNYGYHVMYFVGRDVVTDWEEAVKSELIYNEVSSFIENLSGAHTLKVDDVNKKDLTELYESSITYYASFLTGQ